MTLPAPTGAAAVPTTFSADAPSLDRLLGDLRRRSWGDPVANGRELMRIAAEALGADTLTVWLLGEHGTLDAMLHHPPGLVACPQHAPADAVGARPDLGALRDADADTVTRAESPWSVLDAGLWAQGALVGVLCVKRDPRAEWTPAERTFVAGVADRLAVESVAEARRLAEQASRERERQMDLLEAIAGLGSWEIDLRTDAITWSREQMRIHGVTPENKPPTHVEFLTMVHPDDRAIIDGGMSRLNALAPVTVEFRIIRPDDEVRLLQAQGLLVPAADGQLSRVIGTSLDITERRATELALRASEESYRAIFDASNDAIFVHDVATGRILDANRRACAFSDVTLEELRADGLSLIANGPPPFTPDRAVEFLERAAAGESVRFEWMSIQRGTGAELWVEVSLQRVSIRGDDRILALVRDIRDRKRVELALQASEESYRTIFQSASDAMWLHGIDSTAFIEVNDAAVELLGYSAEEQKSLGVEGMMAYPDDVEGLTRAHGHMDRALAGEAQRFEWCSRHKDGSLVWEEVTLRRVNIRGHDHVLATARGINDRKAAEQALRASEENYRGIFQNAADAMWMHDVDTGAFLEVNKAAEETYGYSAEEQKAGGVPLISDGRPPYTAEASLEYVRRAAAGEPQRFEWLCRHKDGRPVWNEVRLRRVTIGGVDRILATARDINDRREKEQALRASEENYRTIFENASDAMWLHDVDTGAFLDVNNAAVELYGFSDDEQKALGVPGLSDGRPPYTPDQGRVYLQRAAAGQPQRFEWLGRHKDGRRVWAEVRLRRVTIGGVDRILATARDINDRKRAEEALRDANEELELRVASRTEELATSNAALAQEVHEHARAKEALLQRTRELEGIFHALPDLYFRLSRDLRILDYRASSNDRLYVPPDAFLGKRLRDVLPDDIVDRFDDALAGARPGELATSEYQLPAGDELRDYEARFFPLDDGTHISVVRDITERKHAERALREREEHFRRLIENTSDFVMIVDETAAITYVGPSVTRMLGYAPEEVMGTRPADLVHPDDVPNVMREFQWILDNPGQTLTSTFRIRHKDGSYRVFENLGRTLSPDSAEQGVVANGRDVTERKMGEAALARAKEDAERANRAKSEFLSRMSHELRTPMNSILGFAQLLARADLPVQQVKAVSHILKAGRHLLNLINEVLEIARIEAGRENFSLEPVALASVMQEAFGLVRPLAQQWEVELREGAWPRDAFVQADRQRLVQVLLNLLSNAIKYNRRGGYVRLTASVTPAKAGGTWTVRVEDSGRGIPAERAGQLFTPFARLGAEQTDVEGTGLGLALSRRLCEAMGGDLALERTDDSGSVFRLELAVATDPLGALEETGTFAVPVGPHRAATLLYVEDNLANLSLVDTILLSRPGWRTLPALQGQLGVELAREHTPDIILLDLHLPDIPGEEVLRRLRGDARTARIPIVVVSADATPQSLDRLRAAGADAYLTKPLDVDDFLRVVESFLPPLDGGHA